MAIHICRGGVGPLPSVSSANERCYGRRSLPLAGNYHGDNILTLGPHPVRSPSSHDPSLRIPPRGRIFFFFLCCSMVLRSWPRMAFLEDCESPHIPLSKPAAMWNHSVLPPYAPAMYVRTSIQSARVPTVPAGRHSATAMGQLDTVDAFVVEPLSRRGPPLPPFLFSGQLLVLMQDGRTCTRSRNIIGPLSSQSLVPPRSYRPRGCEAFIQADPKPWVGRASDGWHRGAA